MKGAMDRRLVLLGLTGAVAGLLLPFRHVPLRGLVYALPKVIGMQFHQSDPTHDPTYLREACTRFTWLANYYPTNKDWFVDIGAVDAAIVAMKRFPDKKLMQIACASAVSTMSLYNFKVQTYAGQKGAVELVVDLMRRWPEDPHCQVGGNSGCFMDFSWENRLRFQLYGGLEVMLDAIRNHMDNPDVVVQSWFGFSSGTQDPNMPRFVEAGGPEVGVECMRKHPKSFRVREEIMQAMRSTLTVAKHRNHLADVGYIGDLIQAMNDAPLDYHQISPACANLAAFVSTNRTHRLMAHKANATGVALQAIIDYPRMKATVNWAAEFDAQYTVYSDCLGVLASMVAVCEAHKYLLQANAAEVMKGVLAGRAKKHGGSTEMAKMGWTSGDNLVPILLQHILDVLEKPCVDDERDLLHSL